MRDHCKSKVKAMGDRIAGKVRINNAGCLDRCEKGPVMVVYPEAVWYTYVDQRGHRRDRRKPPDRRQGGRAPPGGLNMSRHERVLVDGPDGKIEVFVEDHENPAAWR
jgi:hypothetical protein